MKELKKTEFQEQQFQVEGVLGFPKISKVFMKASILLMDCFAKKVVNKVYFMNQIILQLKDTLNKVFSRGSLC